MIRSRTSGTARAALAALACPLLLGACGGPQSALVTAGRDAERIAELWWWLAGAALLVWIAVVGLAVYLIRVDPESHSPRKAGLLIIGGGVFPTFVLAGLLVFGLRSMPALLAPGPTRPSCLARSGSGTRTTSSTS